MGQALRGSDRRRRWIRRAVYVLLAASLWQLSCVDIATRSVINGFFNGLTAYLQSQLSGAGGAGP